MTRLRHLTMHDMQTTVIDPPSGLIPRMEALESAMGDIEDFSGDVDSLLARMDAVESVSAIFSSQISALQSGKFNVPTGSTSQYLRGDGTLASFPSIPSAQVNSDWNASSGVAQILNKPSLATVATSGSYNDLSSKPTIPTNTNQLTNGSGFITSAPVQSVAGKTGTVTLVKGDVGLGNVDNTADSAKAFSALQITSGTKTSAFISDFVEAAQDAIGSALSAEFVYDDAVNAISLRPQSISTPTFSSVTTATQLSATRNALVTYSFDATVAISVITGQSVTATLTYADNSAMTTNPVIVDKIQTSNGGVLGLSQTNTLKLSGKILAGKYRKVTFAVTGGASAPSVLSAGQEVLE